MIRFNCDYSEGACPQIMELLQKTNMEQTPGYGQDGYCMEAAALIRERIGRPEAGVHFLVGGTQANLTVIAAALRPHQGVAGADTAHISVHETGAVEATGHKVLALPSKDGKITAAQVEELYRAHISDEAFEHTVQPGMVYISQPTELGTLYTRDELKALYGTCRKNGLFLYVDGARLAYGLGAEGNDVDLKALAENCDAFYIGGTKCGALFGEAVVILNAALDRDFRYMIKQRGGMLAKGRLLGIQFKGLLEGGLYEELGRRGDRLADRLRVAFREKGWSFHAENRTNQIFPILTDTALEELKEKYAFTYQCRVDEGRSAVRFCTSWATREEDVEALIRDLPEAGEGVR